MTDKLIAVVGLGYVGLPLAVEFGKKRKVIGFDINTNRISELKNGFDSSNGSLLGNPIRVFQKRTVSLVISLP